MEDNILRKNRTQKEIDVICDDWKSSGLTKAKYCKQNNLNASSLVKWIKRFGKTKNGNNTDTDNLKFFPVGKKSDIDASSSHSVLEFTLPGGIFFKAQLSEATIKSLLQDLLK